MLHLPELLNINILNHIIKNYQKRQKLLLVKNSVKNGMKQKKYYPVNNDKNNNLYKQYKELADKEYNVLFGGRLVEYKCYDMKVIIEAVFKQWNM